MTIFVWILGGLLGTAGIAGYIYGIDMLPTERGVAATIASVVAISAAMLIVAVGCLLRRLDQILARLAEKPAQGERPADVVAMPAPVIIRDEPARPVIPVEPLDAVVAIQPERPAAPVPMPESLPVADPVVPRVEVAVPAVSVPPEDQVKMPEPEKPGSKFKFRLPGFKSAATVAAGAAAAVTAAAVADTPKPEPAPEPVPEPAPLDIEAAVAEAVASVEAGEAQDAPVAADPDIAPVVPSVIEDDAMRDLEAELDRLLPLSPPAKRPSIDLVTADKTESKPEPEPVVLPPKEPEEEIPTSILADPGELDALDAPVRDKPTPGAEVVGAYESGGARYTMYSDGSVMAETADGQLFFESLEKLRDFIENGTTG